VTETSGLPEIHTSDYPNHWVITRLKYLADINNGLDYKHVQSDQGFPVIGSGGQFAWASTYLYDGEAVLLGRKGTIDKPLYVKGKFWTVDTMFYAVCKRAAYAKYFYYLATTIPFSFYSTSTALPSMTQSDLLNHAFAVPPKNEQIAIARFLDEKIVQIENAIRTKEQQIALLKERKQMLIQNAVIRGLNPDAPMRDSGEDWIGVVPEHWELRRVKSIFRLVMELSGKRHDHELLSIYTDIGVRPRKDLEEKGNKASTTDDYWLVRRGDFIVNKLLAWMGAIGLSEYEGVTSPAYDILRPVADIDGQYYHYLFRTKLCTAELKKRSRGIMEMRLRLYFDRFGSLRVPLPPKSEQTEIVGFITTESEKLDKAMDLLAQQITKLKEYKKTLINSAVSGKIKVPGAVGQKEKEETLV
jgi:type I restriction enzyme S subunit